MTRYDRLLELADSVNLPNRAQGRAQSVETTASE
jgi:hypothetical protein